MTPEREGYLAAAEDPCLGELLAECCAYKGTLFTDLVVKRKVQLHRDRIVTSHLAGDPSSKQWLLDRGCKLDPDYVDELVKHKRVIRPPKTWTVTATVRGGNQPIELYCLNITWPTSWVATRGYTSLSLGWETLEEAVTWYNLLQQRVSWLRLAEATSSADGAALSAGSGRSLLDLPGHLISGVLGRRGSQSQGNEGAQAPGGAAGAGGGPDGASGEPEDYRMEDSDWDSEEEEEFLDLEEDELVEARWVPYRHTNGVAIYHHNVGAGTSETPGGEYMASSIVRGSPDDCLAVLMDLSSHTTILGPASQIELLEDSPERQVVRITVEATGMVRRLTAPRQVVVERVFKREDNGVDVILFTSCEPPPGAAGAVNGQRRIGRAVHGGGSSTGAAAAEGGSCSGSCAVASSWSNWLWGRGKAGAGGSGSSSGNSWLWGWWNPVRATVRGGYTISPREDAAGQVSPECLVTCILKVDLGGSCGQGSWFHPLADALGWVDAYVERMLMAVILVKDEVEQQRFLVQPFSMLTAPADGQQAAKRRGRQRAAAAAAAAAAEGLSSEDVEAAAAAAAEGGPEKLASLRMSQITPNWEFPRSGSVAARWRDAFGGDGGPGKMRTRMQLQRTRSRRRGEGVGAGSVPHSPRRVLSGAERSATSAAEAGVLPGSDYYEPGPYGPVGRLSTLAPQYYSEIHSPGTPAPFQVRGPNYLTDHKKTDAGFTHFVLGAVDLVQTDGPTQHISRFLPCVRQSQAPWSFVVNLIIPGTPVISLVAVFINEHHPSILDAPSPAAAAPDGGSGSPAREEGAAEGSSNNTDAAAGDASVHSSKAPAVEASADSFDSDASRLTRPSVGLTAGQPDKRDWEPFDHVLHRFLHAGDEERTNMLKLIPCIAEGSWVIKQSVGTVPVIVGSKLKTYFFQTERYLEATVDVTSSSVAAHITGMVRGATRSLVIDLAFLLEAQQEQELPEALIGAFRLNHLDCTTAKHIDTTKELPLLPLPKRPPTPPPAAAGLAGGSAAAGAARGAGGAFTPAGAAAEVGGAAEGQQQRQQAGQVAADGGVAGGATGSPAVGVGGGGPVLAPSSSRKTLVGVDVAGGPTAPTHGASSPPGTSSSTAAAAAGGGERHAAARSSLDAVAAQGNGGAGHRSTRSISAGISAIGAKAQRLIGKHRHSRSGSSFEGVLSPEQASPHPSPVQLPHPAQQHQHQHTSSDGSRTPLTGRQSQLQGHAHGHSSSSVSGADGDPSATPTPQQQQIRPSPFSAVDAVSSRAALGTPAGAAGSNGASGRAGRFSLTGGGGSAGLGVPSQGPFNRASTGQMTSSSTGTSSTAAATSGAAAGSSPALRHHRRTSSSSEAGRLGLSGDGGGGGSGSGGILGSCSGSKLSASAYISRAHAAAKAAAVSGSSSNGAVFSSAGAFDAGGAAGGLDGQGHSASGSTEAAGGAARSQQQQPRPSHHRVPSSGASPHAHPNASSSPTLAAAAAAGGGAGGQRHPGMVPNASAPLLHAQPVGEGSTQAAGAATPQEGGLHPAAADGQGGSLLNPSQSAPEGMQKLLAQGAQQQQGAGDAGGEEGGKWGLPGLGTVEKFVRRGHRRHASMGSYT